MSRDTSLCGGFLFRRIGEIREISGLPTSTLQQINDLTLRSQLPA